MLLFVLMNIGSLWRKAHINFLNLKKIFMSIKHLKEKLHFLIESTDNEVLLKNLLYEARNSSGAANEEEGLSEEDYKELLSLINEPPEKDTISYNELKSSLNKWFTK